MTAHCLRICYRFQLREVELVRLCLKHFRQQGYDAAFKALQEQTNVSLEDPKMSELHTALVVQGDFQKAENFIEKAVSGKWPVRRCAISCALVDSSRFSDFRRWADGHLPLQSRLQGDVVAARDGQFGEAAGNAGRPPIDHRFGQQRDVLVRRMGWLRRSERLVELQYQAKQLDIDPRAIRAEGGTVAAILPQNGLRSTQFTDIHIGPIHGQYHTHQGVHKGGCTHSPLSRVD